jgi:RNA polymerase sigma-54 factor
MFQRHYQVLRPLTTAHLAQTMTLLSLTVGELRQQIDSELASNPALELIEERRCPSCHRLLPPRGTCPVCSCPPSDRSEEPVVFISPREDFYPKGDVAPDSGSEDDYSTEVDDLPTYVLRQIAPELNPRDRRLAAYLLTNLDEDGLLTVSLFEVARYFHVPIADVEAVQRIIQRSDPLGVGSSTPRDALLVQLELLSETRRVPELALRIVREGMELMSRRQYAELARMFKVTSAKVQQAINFISENLNPFPARSHWGDVRQPSAPSVTTYHQPDIIISYLNDDPTNPLMVEIIMPLHGTLRINPLFRSAINQASAEKKEEWKSDLERASLFVKCLQQRNHTMQRLIQRVVALQKGFIINGERHLVPVTRARLSQELEVHESTISRAVANKTVQLPNRRIIAFSAFFDRSLNVRTVLKDLIADESSPLSDSELSELLAEKGFSVARRTVAKYRAMEGILPAHLRNTLAGQHRTGVLS